MAVDIECLIHEIDDGCLFRRRMEFGLLGVSKRRPPAAIGIEGVDNHQFGVGRNDEFRIEQASRLFLIQLFMAVFVFSLKPSTCLTCVSYSRFVVWV